MFENLFTTKYSLNSNGVKKILWLYNRALSSTEIRDLAK